MEMRLIFALIFIVMISSASAINYTVSISDGIGVKSEKDFSKVHAPLSYKVIINDTIRLSDAMVMTTLNEIKASDGLNTAENSGVSDTSEPQKEPINWTPFIIWSIIILFLIILIWAGFYFYEMFTYYS